MRLIVRGWMPPVAWFVAGVFATGAFWYYLSKGSSVGSWSSAVCAALFVALAVYLQRQSDPAVRNRPHRDQLASFLTEAQALRARKDEVPLPVEEHNQWVEKVETYLRRQLGTAYSVRFGNFSGMTFHGSGSEKSKYERSLDGRARRLMEFIKELGELIAHQRRPTYRIERTRERFGGCLFVSSESWKRPLPLVLSTTPRRPRKRSNDCAPIRSPNSNCGQETCVPCIMLKQTKSSS